MISFKSRNFYPLMKILTTYESNQKLNEFGNVLKK